jgi:hypothetical protein
MLGLDKISKNTKIYNTYFDKELEYEYEYENEKLHKEAEEDYNDSLDDGTPRTCKFIGTKEYTDKIRDKLKTGVGCSVTISGLRRMKQWYYEYDLSDDDDDDDEKIVNL